MNVSPSTRDIVRKSYEFALNHVGQDKESGDIWNDYIQFLKAGEVRLFILCIFFSANTFLTDDNNMGRTAENGCIAQGLPSGCTNSLGQRRVTLARTRSIRGKSQQDHRQKIHGRPLTSPHASSYCSPQAYEPSKCHVPSIVQRHISASATQV